MEFKTYHELAISYSLYTNLDATEIMRTSEHAEGCRLDVYAFYHHQQLNELKRLAAEDLRPVWEIYDELASSASTSLDTAAYFPDFYTAQARNTMYYSRAMRYPRLPAMRQDLRLTAEPTTTKSGAQFSIYHSPTNCPILVPAVAYTSFVYEGQTATRRIFFDFEERSAHV
ncbi:hypothetical protein T4E_6390 [Trichinella pseudospiralis]|uniref:Uncharacterized protein n=1 Tax=Trichinella pseudospiralis TaxID=6337 RepID=A0A0V0YG23_TRIPS|nr:hypothetical protein T4E_6390 [Trichinella pseudospiralis]